MALKKTIKKVTTSGALINNYATWRKSNPTEICFDSKFEYDCYKLLVLSNFNFTFHPDSRELRSKFQTLSLSSGKGKRKLIRSTVRSISYTPDFSIYCNDGTVVFIEAKGFFHPEARIRYKLFQASLNPNEISILVMQKNKNMEDMKGLIRIINEELGGSDKSKKIKVEDKRINIDLL